MVSERRDVVVVGGGVVGIACALELARRGAEVTVLERDRVGAACSSGNAGLLTPSVSLPLPAPGLFPKALLWLFDSSSPLYIEPRWSLDLARWLAGFLAATSRRRFERGTEALVGLSRASVEFWADLARRGPDSFGFRDTGLLQVFETPASFAAGRSKADLVSRFGVVAETWTADEVRQREPALAGPVAGAYFYVNEGHCEPALAVAALTAEARRHGVRFVEGAEVWKIRRSVSRVAELDTTRGTFRADEVVIAAGAWSGRLAAELGVRLPMLGAKGYTLLVPPVERMPRRAYQLADRKIAVTPHDERLRLSGTLELVDLDFSITESRVAAIAAGARAALGLAEPLAPTEVWRGLRPTLPDGLPAIGRSPAAENLWLATGHQMTGLKTAPATGRLLAELMSGAAPSFDPAPFRPDRFGR